MLAKIFLRNYGVLFIGPFIVVCVLGVSLFFLFKLEVHGLYVGDTTRVTAKPATVSCSISKPLPPLVVTSLGLAEFTLVRPTSSYTRVYLGGFRGFDTSTFGPKTLDYITSSKPIFNSGRSYNFRHLPKFMRPTATWRSGM
nr:nonstructural protein NS4 [Betacoronavirus sp.]